MVGMHAIEVAQTGGPEVLRFVEKPRRSPGADEVLIKAEAIGVNFVDTYFRSGLYPHQLPFVLGAEVAGVVEAVADGVSPVRLGDRVASADAVGAYAEYCIAPVDLVASLPDGVAADVAASAPLKGMTAPLLIKSVYLVRPGDTVLLHAGAGGVGLILTQWATSLGAHVITTVSTAQCRRLGVSDAAVAAGFHPHPRRVFLANNRITGFNRGRHHHRRRQRALCPRGRGASAPRSARPEDHRFGRVAPRGGVTCAGLGYMSRRCTSNARHSSATSRGRVRERPVRSSMRCMR